jgi:pheromone shutdown protein TraB
MSSMLLKSAREYSSVVAVVGKGHVSGIKKNWQQPIQVSFFFKQKKP